MDPFRGASFNSLDSQKSLQENLPKRPTAAMDHLKSDKISLGYSSDDSLEVPHGKPHSPEDPHGLHSASENLLAYELHLDEDVMAEIAIMKYAEKAGANFENKPCQKPDPVERQPTPREQLMDAIGSTTCAVIGNSVTAAGGGTPAAVIAGTGLEESCRRTVERFKKSVKD